MAPAINIYQLSGGQNEGEELCSTRLKTDRLQTIQPMYKEILPLPNEARTDSKGQRRYVPSELLHAILTHFIYSLNFCALCRCQDVGE